MEQAVEKMLPVIGVDEVGRGALAGDLVVCAFTLDPVGDPGILNALRGLARDSKSFNSRAARARVAEMARRCGLWEIRRAGPKEIARLNIRTATLACMRDAARALRRRSVLEAEVVVDGRDLPGGLASPARAVIGGDGKIFEISCASVIAKDLRDREMVDAAARFPGYGFERHAGYGTAEHRAALGTMGPCALHRSWALKFCRDPSSADR